MLVRAAAAVAGEELPLVEALAGVRDGARGGHGLAPVVRQRVHLLVLGQQRVRQGHQRAHRVGQTQRHPVRHQVQAGQGLPARQAQQGHPGGHHAAAPLAGHRDARQEVSASGHGRAAEAEGQLVQAARLPQLAQGRLLSQHEHHLSTVRLHLLAHTPRLRAHTRRPLVHQRSHRLHGGHTASQHPARHLSGQHARQSHVRLLEHVGHRSSLLQVKKTHSTKKLKIPIL